MLTYSFLRFSSIPIPSPDCSEILTTVDNLLFFGSYPLLLFSVLVRQVADIWLIFFRNRWLDDVSTSLVDNIVENSLIRLLTCSEMVADSGLLITWALNDWRITILKDVERESRTLSRPAPPPASDTSRLNSHVLSLSPQWERVGVRGGSIGVPGLVKVI